ncbi:hypothetical protein [Nostoc sp. WHI]|uniref:hypothetical protein n=1 Tax=Nostoc sp. WHI TaxID=2650611 RepID=UPI0018C79A98|nr:hypothetical protein [Nostoc sp. WHI]MBG1265627.1 hypothetical protein [Nostoc sp. WHI]
MGKVSCVKSTGNLIQQFPLGSKASNMEIAIACYEIALTVYTRSVFPVDWAMTQNNLGIAYGDRILGERVTTSDSASMQKLYNR